LRRKEQFLKQLSGREESDIEKEKAEFQRFQSQKKADEYQKSRLLEEEHQLKEELIRKRQGQNRIQSDFDSSKRRLGQIPEATSYYVKVTDYEYRGGLGIIDALFGPKEVTRKEERYDYSAQEQWKNEERRIKNEFIRQSTESNSQLRSLEQEISSIQQQISELNKTAKTDAIRIDRKKAIIFEKIKSLEEKRIHAAKEYVERQKDKLKNSVCDYLSNTLQQVLTESINNEVIRIKDNLCPEVRELYVDFSRSQKENLQQMLNNNGSYAGIQHESIKQDMDCVITLMNNLEVYLCKQQMQPF
jgi:DNA repair exonuclease SbcCD ATPase subunit